MKFIFGIFSAALATPVYDYYNDYQCPGTCWLEDNGICSPDVYEVNIFAFITNYIPYAA